MYEKLLPKIVKQQYLSQSWEIELREIQRMSLAGNPRLFYPVEDH
jgi:hypothetical protein